MEAQVDTAEQFGTADTPGGSSANIGSSGGGGTVNAAKKWKQGGGRWKEQAQHLSLWGRG